MRTLTFNRVIGAGSFGTVYHAELRVPRGFSRQCAVKVMNATSPDQDHFRARMRDEARLLGMLADEQILGVAELVMADNRDIVVMDYVEGVDLSDIIVSQPVPPRALAEMGAEIAGTLHRAHTAAHPNTGEPLRVVHRDVKPANVMITARGGVRLLDFGVARAAFSARETETQGLVLGTLNYFPPEILAGADPSPAVDIYGLGLILWECATGKEWGSPQVHRKRFERRVEQRLAAVEPDYADLLPVLRAILEWDPAQRPDGGEVEQLLLSAADACTGEGLRTWARMVVPPILEARQSEQLQDELVGRTLPLQGEEQSDGLQPIPEAVTVKAETSVESVTYNDLAPPAAVDRATDRPLPVAEVRELAIPRAFGEADDVVTEKNPSAAPIDRPPPPRVPQQQQQRSPAPRPKKAAKGGNNLYFAVGAAVVVGSIIGVLLVFLVLLLLILIKVMS
ncbi:MAG: serine/threonine protein kinase [Alphaproteobacteria bacterium]|nr:serine/threonine protein kinase [Alphaproteobacteria bacterium]